MDASLPDDVSSAKRLVVVVGGDDESPAKFAPALALVGSLLLIPNDSTLSMKNNGIVNAAVNRRRLKIIVALLVFHIKNCVFYFATLAFRRL